MDKTINLSIKNLSHQLPKLPDLSNKINYNSQLLNISKNKNLEEIDEFYKNDLCLSQITSNELDKIDSISVSNEIINSNQLKNSSLIDKIFNDEWWEEENYLNQHFNDDIKSINMLENNESNNINEITITENSSIPLKLLKRKKNIKKEKFFKKIKKIKKFWVKDFKSFVHIFKISKILRKKISLLK